MITCSKSATIQGVDVCTVDIEVGVNDREPENGSSSMPPVCIIGLPDAAIRESRDRIRSAIKTSGFRMPKGASTINLAPADLRKSGAAFDLPVALCIISALNIFADDDLKKSLIVGELALDGQVRGVPGVLPMVLHARELGLERAIVPLENAMEAAAVEGINVYGVKNLREAVLFFVERRGLMPVKVDPGSLFTDIYPSEVDFLDVKGQEAAKRAILIAAAGQHNLLMIGQPGVGKSLIANRIPTILPRLELSEALEVTKIHSIAGKLPEGVSLITRRPFRAPHHSVSDAGLLGGGSGIPRPGEISLAHRGVLFLDELPEFRRTSLEALRQPLESGNICIARASGSFTFPAKMMLIAAMNPCPCGYFGSHNHKCTCNPGMVKGYRSRISGPMVDRLDLHIEIPPLPDKVLVGKRNGESSASMRQKVANARAIQVRRFQGTGIFANADMNGRLLDQFCQLSESCKKYLLDTINSLNMSARAYDRLLRVSRTIADLAGNQNISEEHIAEAVNYRCLDRPLNFDYFM